jgi:hypothetical protein
MSSEHPSNRPWDREPRERREPREHREPPTGGNGMAVAAIVCGGIALLLGPLLGVPAMILGGIALTRPHGRTAAVLGIVLGGLGSVIIPIVLVYAVGKVRETAARLSDQNNLMQIGLAFHSYHDVHGRVSRYAPNPRGEPNAGLSWRVALLPYLEHDNLARRFDFSSSWEAPSNRALVSTPVKVFHTPLGANPLANGETPYRVFVGGGALFADDGKPSSLVGMADQPGHTILVAHATEQVPWAAPRELPYAPTGALPRLGHFGGPGWWNVCLANGSVRAVPADTPERTVRALVTSAGGEPVDMGW